jgi:hypothetical protein
MRKILPFLLILVLASAGVLIYQRYSPEAKRFERHEALVKDAKERLDAGEWSGAERDVRELLKEMPDDTNLQVHLAGILYEQGRYEDCIAWVDGRSFRNADLDFLEKKSKSILYEMRALNLEDSRHFRVEFEGEMERTDVVEALSVLETAYDSLARLFDFYPENKIHLVLYRSAEYQGVGEHPDWAAAIFDGKLRMPVNAMRFREWYRPILFHELTHAFIQAIKWKDVPLWLNEGIAQVIDGSRIHDPRPRGAVPSVELLTEPFVREKNISGAEKLYWYSLRMTQELLRADPSFVKLRDLLRSLSGGNTDSRLRELYGVDSAELLRRAADSGRDSLFP